MHSGESAQIAQVSDSLSHVGPRLLGFAKDGNTAIQFSCMRLAREVSSWPMKAIVVGLVLNLLSTVYAQQAGPPSANGLHYALLNDTSGKTLWPRGISQQVTLETQFLAEVVKPGSDIGSLVNFSEEFFLDVQNSKDPNAIAAKLIREGRHATKIYDSLVATARWLDKYQFPDTHKAIFLFSDGDDNASFTSLQGAIAAVQAVHIPIFVVAPSTVEHKR